ncbi:MAG: hypothetical protein C0485_02215 [Pirellula sp.]|nr:hypothetical protein [Pirellula sp.]
MTKNSGKQKVECGMNAVKDRSPRTDRLRHSHRGLTLIELLITIVIMVTVLAGALPLLSPNNNSRKLREASRQLNSLFAQAQAQAARDGRPVGVAFRESGTSAPYSGMAMEAYMIAEPAPFTGFSEHSRVTVIKPRADEKLTYGQQEDGNTNGNGGTLFDPRYRGYGLWELAFLLYGSEDPIPPRMVRNGDVINVNGNLFLIVDDGGSTEGAHQVDQATGYIMPTGYLLAIWLNYDGQQMALGAQRTYAFARQPVNTSEQPLQFPRGVGIDLVASGADGLNVPGQFDEVLPITSTKITPLTIGIMFSPNGSLDALYVDGVRKDGVDQVYFLMGLFENGNSEAQDPADYDFTAGTDITDDELAQRRTRINWLNADSRWVSVNRAGRIITTENNISFDPRIADYSNNISGTEQEQNRVRINRQLNGIGNYPGARQNANRMSGSTGR